MMISNGINFMLIAEQEGSCARELGVLSDVTGV